MVRVFVFAAFAVLATPLAASAADLDTRLAAGAAETDARLEPGLWRGHFSGGTNYDPSAQDIALVWTDQVAYFPDPGTCRRWIHDLRARVRPYQGYSGCLRIR